MKLWGTFFSGKKETKELGFQNVFGICKGAVVLSWDRCLSKEWEMLRFPQISWEYSN